MENNTDTDNRIEQFKSDVTEMKLKTGSATRDAVFQTIGLVLMVVGVVGVFVVYVSSKNLDDIRDVTSQIVYAIGFLALTVTGAALFLRFALANFLRMWLLRQLYEGQSNTDRIVDAVKGR
jgi:protein-S-isoprenylcysteine O-methyltransferase Ste14